MKKALGLLLALSSCAAHRLAGTQAGAPLRTRDISYTSNDPSRFIVFSPDGARFGPLLNLLPEFPPDATRYFEPSEGVQCVSIGVPGNTLDYAIKRPIRAGDNYQCLTTSFRVVRCFEDCRAAVIQQERRLATNRTLTSSFYVRSCHGVLAISEAPTMAAGIPFDAMLLLGNVGILADPAYPHC